jgi:hypothetical protein
VLPIAASADDTSPSASADTQGPLPRAACQAGINDFLTKYEQAVKAGLDLENEAVKKEFETKKTAVVGLCTAQIALIGKFKEVYESAVAAEDCAEKLKMLQALNGREPSEPPGSPYPRITGAWFGDIINGSKAQNPSDKLVCDARIFFHDQCNGPSGVPKLKGPGYCVAQRTADGTLESGKDLCGYDPAPWANVDMTYEFPREKFIVVQYECVGGKSKGVSTVTVPALSKYVPIICDYTEHYPDLRELDIEKGPCKVELKAKP